MMLRASNEFIKRELTCNTTTLDIHFRSSDVLEDFNTTERYYFVLEIYPVKRTTEQSSSSSVSPPTATLALTFWTNNSSPVFIPARNFSSIRIESMRFAVYYIAVEHFEFNPLQIDFLIYRSNDEDATERLAGPYPEFLAKGQPPVLPR